MTLTETDLDEIGKIVDEKIGTHPKLDKIIETLDGIVGQLNALHEEKDILSQKVTDHEDRITALEGNHN